MIELEVRWRLGELGVPYTEKLGERFKPFRFDSDHRRKLEQLDILAADVKRRDLRERAAAKTGPTVGDTKGGLI